MINLNNTYRRYSYNLPIINFYAENHTQDFISLVESQFRSDLDNIADSIMNLEQKCHIIMLTGPSSSGKTTTAKILERKFEDFGRATHIISLDNFYTGKKNIPRLPNGDYDFEALEALDIPFIKSCIKSILTNGSCMLPKYNFTKGIREEAFTELKADKDSIIIIEGIHALNPIFTEDIEDSAIKKIYISVKQGIKNTEKKILRASDIRFLRRLVRDTAFRGSDGEETISMWDNVCLGEKKYIRPFKYLSDYTLNTFHPYEVCVLKNDAIKILSEVDNSCDDYEYAKNIISALNDFSSIDKTLVPEDSLLREFIGGGLFKY